MIKRLRVEPISGYLERRRKGPIYPVIVANGFVYLSGLPPFDPESGDIEPAPFERQAEIVLDQMKLCLEAAGSSLAKIVKCNVYCTPDPSHFGIFNEVYARYFPTRVARPHLSARAVMAGAVRRGSRMRGGSLAGHSAKNSSTTLQNSCGACSNIQWPAPAIIAVREPATCGASARCTAANAPLVSAPPMNKVGVRIDSASSLHRAGDFRRLVRSA